MGTVFARSALREAVDGVTTGVPVATIDPIDDGNNHSYRITRDDGSELFLKVGTRFPETFPAEPAAMSFLRRETAIPIPQVYATGEAPLDYPFAIYEFVPGTGVDSVASLPPASARRLCQEAGAHLGSLHDVTFAQFGSLAPDGDALSVTESLSYPEMLRGSLERQLSELAGTPFADRRGDLSALGSDLIDELEFGDVRPALVHGDYRPENLRIDPSADPETVAVLDWERPTAIDPLWDAVMARALLTDGYGLDQDERDSLRSAFWTAYGGNHAGTVRRECYELLARIRLARHLDAEMQGETDDAVRERIGQHHAAFDELLAPGTTF